jgi:nucleotide-binding universal stress UspA family protein
MSFKDIVVQLDSTHASRVRLHLAMSLARRFDARLSGLHVIPEPDLPPYFKPSVVRRIAEIYADNAREAADRAETMFRQQTANAAASTTWECFEGDTAELIGERARFADLLVLGQFDTENPHGISHFLLPAKVVFGTASPILVVPNNGTFDDIGKRIVVTWDGSREAARAIRDAMPLLKSAHEVSLFAVDLPRQGHMHGKPDSSRFADHLARHGITVSVREDASSKHSVTDAILTHVGAFNADLLVMGAYGHSPVWEFIVGGTTPALLERTTVPVLMSR